DKLLALVGGGGEGASFSPAGVLRVETGEGDELIETAHGVLLEIRGEG
ncbi:MAG: hypothetical protein H0T60_11400, partial [Acidobacteria bacterium]|nr:hypothetical protein [Acidobacteriota bacterium]